MKTIIELLQDVYGSEVLWTPEQLINIKELEIRIREDERLVNWQANASLKIINAEQLLNEWLVDNTVELFEEIPEVDEARVLLVEAIELMNKESP
jgi:hypothetical protein